MILAVNPALERDALFAKSQLYIRRGVRANEERQMDEYQLWASLSLELLGKAALAKVHPALVADPTHFQSMFAACGRQISPDTKSITAKTLFERLTHLNKAFDHRHQKFCEQMAIRRNAELHSGDSPFSGMSPDAWEREFWGVVETVLSMQEETLESWLGADDAKAPARIIEQATQALEWAVKNRVGRCIEDFQKKYPKSSNRQVVVDASKNLQWDDRTWDAISRCVCPACRSSGFVGGTLWNEEVVWNESGWDESDDRKGGYGETAIEIVEKLYSIEAFECLVCGLRLVGKKEISAANFPEDFTLREQREMEFEPDYGND